MSHAELLDELRNSVFCLMPPGDWASSNRLGEAILAGCIPVVGCRMLPCVVLGTRSTSYLPVSTCLPRIRAAQPTLVLGSRLQFYGPPWHTMPLNTGEVDYAGLGVFLNVTGSWQNHTKCAHNMKWWHQTASVQHVTVPLPNLSSIYTYLRYGTAQLPMLYSLRHQ
jgi:hypothetical protein